MSDARADALQRTTLFDYQRVNGAKFVPFAGYEMPVQYELGVLKEHLHVRASAGIFDISHMGQIFVRHRSGKSELTALALEETMPADIVGLGVGRQRYGLLLHEGGGILDDVMVANKGDSHSVIVNAATKAQDFRLLRDAIGDRCDVQMIERSLIAVQGPLAEDVLLPYLPKISQTKFMDVISGVIEDDTVTISRSGYTGEDGFEISIANERCERFVSRLLTDSRVKLIGLGARDSLRLEAGLCLYGSDIDSRTTPAEAGLEWSIQKARRIGGARQGGFPGAARVLTELSASATRRRVGIRPLGKAPIRSGCQLFEKKQSTKSIGLVTSGSFGPTIGHPVAMGYVAIDKARPGIQLYAEVRGNRHEVVVENLPFVPDRFKRG